MKLYGTATPPQPGGRPPYPEWPDNPGIDTMSASLRPAPAFVGCWILATLASLMLTLQAS